MTWTKLDDRFWMHPGILMVGNTAAGVFARMLSYCGAYLTDGVVPASVVQTIVGSDRRSVDALARAGLVVPLESGGVEVPDYLDYNRSKAQVEADVEQRREASKRRWNGRNGS